MSRCVFMNPHVWPLKIFSASEIYEALDNDFAWPSGNKITDADGYTVVHYGSNGVAWTEAEAKRKYLSPLNIGKYKLSEDPEAGKCVEIHAKEGKLSEAFFHLVPRERFVRSSRYLSICICAGGANINHIDVFINSVHSSPTINNVSPSIRYLFPQDAKDKWSHILIDLDSMKPEFKEHNDMRTIRCLRFDFVNVPDRTALTNEYAKIKYIGFFRTRELAEDYYNQIMKIKESK